MYKMYLYIKYKSCQINVAIYGVAEAFAAYERVCNFVERDSTITVDLVDGKTSEVIMSNVEFD